MSEGSERIECLNGLLVFNEITQDYELIDFDVSEFIGPERFFSASYSESNSVVGLYLTKGFVQEQSYIFRANFQIDYIPAYCGFLIDEKQWIEIYLQKEE